MATHRHNWQSPHTVVGGDERNHGVWSSGAAVIFREVCSCCGKYRRTASTHIGTRRTTTFEPADAKSSAWASAQ